MLKRSSGSEDTKLMLVSQIRKHFVCVHACMCVCLHVFVYMLLHMCEHVSGGGRTISGADPQVMSTIF